MATVCSRCYSPLPAGVPEANCPRCLLAMAAASRTATYGGSDFVPPTPEQLAPAFPNLQIESMIGQGGMGAVYKARHRGLDRPVALKILPPQYAARPDFAARFEREARALARLSHPNIVNVFDSGRAGDFYYLIMEYIDGVNLRQAIQARAIEPAEALSIVPQICEALQYAHDQGVVHRDIKPENILLDRQGRVRIADFGLARMLDHEAVSDTLTGTHQVLGTPRYMAPEQIEGTHTVDHRADIYSLGVVFYELLTGELPLGRFDAPSARRGIDRRLDRIVFRTLEKRPDARYQQASQVKTDVEALRSNRCGMYHDDTFREYRSKTTVFGLPFYHFAQGRDPKTGKRAVAKGIIAVGEQAVGVLAIGGFAAGGIAIGGSAAGLFAIGGTSFSLLAGIGGVVLTTGLGLGGVAIGSMVLGGVALGVVAVGGSSFGLYSTGGFGRQTGPPPNFVLREIPILISVLLFSFLPLLLGLFAIGRMFGSTTDSSEDFSGTSGGNKPPRLDATASGSPSSILFSVLLPLLLFGLILFGFIAAGIGIWLFAARSIPPAPAPSIVGVEPVPSFFRTADGVLLSSEGRVPGQIPRDWNDVEYTFSGPVLSREMVIRLSLFDDIRREIDERLQRAFREADQLQVPGSIVARLHEGTSRKAWRIAIPEGEKAPYLEIEARLWADLDQLLDPRQQALLRERLHPTKTVQAVPNSLSFPGLFGFVDRGGVIEIELEGSWYRWRVESQGYHAEGTTPELPGELLRYKSMLPGDEFPGGAIEKLPSDAP